MAGSQGKHRPIVVWLGFWIACLALWGCTAAPGWETLGGSKAGQPEAAVATPTPLSPYAAEMLAQGFVELVGDDLASATLPADPSQADLGAEPYRQICLACHGDWGQGLTDQWRAEWGEDSNCWQSRCHAANHPEQGFRLPKSVPPVLGSGALVRFDTASEAQQSIAETMPWWKPGSLTEEQSWSITAYLMRARGEADDQITLDKDNATAYRLHAPYRPVPDPRPGGLLLVLFLAAATVGLIWRRRQP